MEAVCAQPLLEIQDRHWSAVGVSVIASESEDDEKTDEFLRVVFLSDDPDGREIVLETSNVDENSADFHRDAAFERPCAAMEISAVL